MLARWPNKICTDCHHCGLSFFRESGYYIGGMIITYGLTLMVVIPVFLFSRLLPDLKGVSDDGRFALWVLFGVPVSSLLMLIPTIQTFLAQKRNSGLSGSSVHGMRTALSKVLQAAVDWNFIELNPARGIRIGDRGPKTERLYLNSSEALRLLPALPEPCHMIVLIAVLTGMRIGEILALRWKYLDLLRGVIQIRETVSEGLFGSPKTRSSRRDLPMSDRVRKAFEVQRAQSRQTGPEDLVFATRKQTPLNPKNLLRRVLRPTCDALKLPAITWHSFRHTHATLLGEVGESIRTAQALLGHSDLETTLNVYTHAIPESQRRAVDKVAEVLFADVRKTAGTSESETVN